MSAPATKVFDPNRKIQAGRWERCELTPQQQRMWDETRTAVLWHAPAFAHIFYTLMNPTGHKHQALFTKDVPIAATDGVHVLLNPDTFFKYTLNERVFIIVHEIMHCIFDHCGLMYSLRKRGKIVYKDGSSRPYHDQIMNVAMDYVINDCLIDSKIGKYNKDWLHNTTMATFADSAIDAYKKVYDSLPPPPPGGGGSGKGDGQGPGQPDTNGQQSFDQHLDPGTSQGKDPQQGADERAGAKQQWDTEVAAAVASARAQGKLPGALERLLTELLEPQVDWREKLRSAFSRRVGNDRYDWSKLDRRLIVRGIGAPGRSGFGCGHIVVAIDTSGSIGKSELDMFMAEVAGILEDAQPRAITIIWCDASIGRVDEVDRGEDLKHIRAKDAPGGGGTSFLPPFKYVFDGGIKPDCLVYLTDGYGPFPEQPPFPVIWGNISPPGQIKYPFGEVVDIPKQVA